MAVRKIYLPLAEFPYVREVPVTFAWSNGSKHQNIRAAQEAFHEISPETPVLEVSLASMQPEGAAVAAMKLPLHLASLEQEVPVGIVYESAKVSENGGPCPELLQCSRQKVQKDLRQQKRGKCTGYRLEEIDYPVEPHPYAFFNWLYGCALQQNADCAEALLQYGAFSDLDLGSAKKDRNSPARAAAVYAGLSAAHRLDCLASYATFVECTCEGQAPVQPEPVPEPLPVQTELTEPEPQPEPVPAAPEETAQEPAAPEPEVMLPTAEQMEEICRAPKVKNLMISLAKNAGCTANSAAGAIRAGRELLLTSYRKALEEKTALLNPERNKVVFPLENPDNDFATTGQLTRCPAFVQGWKLSYQPCEAVQAAKPAVQAPPAAPEEEPVPLTAEDHLIGCGYVITRQVQQQDLPPLAVQKLAWETGEAMGDPVVAAFLQFIRSHLQFHDVFTFRVPKEASTESRERVVALAQSWDHLGLFSVLSASTSRILCKLASENDVVRNFASGHWLELYVVHSVQQLLEQYRTGRNATVSLCSNVILSDPPEAAFAHELDVVFSVNGVFFWIEAKSSSRNIDYGKYADLCSKLQVTPDRLLLVNSDLTEEDCRGVSYFWPYRIANCATMTGVLTEMIDKALGDAGAEKTE